MIRLLHVDEGTVERHLAEADELFGPALAEAEALFARLEIESAADRWLRNMAWKRVAAALLLGDVLRGRASARTLLEVGGGLSALTLILAERYDYKLIEKATHEPADAYRRVEQVLGRDLVNIGDWAEVPIPEELDLLIALDVFPNVDQRLYEFADRFLPVARELRLTLTYYENTIFDVERIPSRERLVVKPWGVRELRGFLDYLAEAYDQHVAAGDREQLFYVDQEGTVFGNRRNVLLAWIET